MDSASDPRVWLTVDVVLLAVVDDRTHVLLIQRAADSDAYPGRWSLPGGYVDPDERIATAARRELVEETGITEPARLACIGIYDRPDRDPRGRVVSVAYAAALPAPVTAHAGDDAAAACWVSVADAVSGRYGGPLAFDHEEILVDAIGQIGDAPNLARRTPGAYLDTAFNNRTGGAHE